jgi:hypothetical protein
MVSTVSVLLIPGVDVACFRSSFIVQIGESDLRLLPSISLGMPLLISPGACPPRYNTSDDRICVDSRGGVYRHNNSISYKPDAINDLAMHNTLYGFGFPSFPRVGWDQIKFGGQAKSERLSWTPRILIAEAAMENDTWLGLLGLDLKPMNLSSSWTGSSMLPGMVESLVDQLTIPSRSWAYTAGSRWCKQFLTCPTERN